MANEQNLVPFGERTESERREIARKAGVESGKARREAKKRGEVWREIMSLKITDEEKLAKAREMGVEDEYVTLEKYLKALATEKMLKHPDMQDVVRLDDELYGKQDNKTQLEVSGDISGITINIKDFSKGKDGTTN